MIEIRHHPVYQSHVFPSWTSSAKPAWVLVVKSSYGYQTDGSVTMLPKSEALVMADEYPQDDPEKYGPSAVSDLAPFKHGAEIILHAHAISEQPRATFQVSAELRSAKGPQWQKKLQVFGPRVWKKTLLGTTYTDPELVSELPISYEYSYGGCDPDNEEDVYPGNPVGLGYVGKASSRGRSLPQIEWPEQLLKTPRQQPLPAGFGPLPGHWQPRLDTFPEIDEQKLMAGGYPYHGKLPSTCYHSAPQDQWLDQPLHGQYELILTGMNQDLAVNQPLQCSWNIPSLAILLVTHSSARQHELMADTLIVDTQKQHLHLLYRIAFEDLPERFQGEVRFIAEEQSA